MKNRIERIMAEMSVAAASLENDERFVQVPAFFYQGKSNEQFAAMQQVYQQAYEKAVRQQQAESATDDLHWGEGI